MMIAYTNRVMAKRATITESLKRAVRDSGLSLYAICKATGLNEDSLSRFMRGDQSLVLSKADKLASFFGIECQQKEKGKNERNARV